MCSSRRRRDAVGSGVGGGGWLDPSLRSGGCVLSLGLQSYLAQAQQRHARMQVRRSGFACHGGRLLRRDHLTPDGRVR